MKNLLLIALMAFSLVAGAIDVEVDADAQSQLQELMLLHQSLDKQIREAFAKKDYSRAAELNYQALSLIDQHRDVLMPIVGGERQLNGIKSYYHYDLACAYSRRGMTEGAFYHLQQAVRCDYNDWKHILEDHDLDNLRHDPRLDEAIATIRSRADYLLVLKQAASYVRNERTDTLPTFTFQSPDNPDLRRVRAYFKLDSVAGYGDELSKIKNIMTYVHNLIKHDGQHANPAHLNAIDMAEACRDGSRGLNCRGLAIVLSECYLAMGIPAHHVTCMPKEYINDCHVINSVWSSQLKKWIWIDPSFNAWVTNEKGNLLSIQEVRDHLRNDVPVVLNNEANWNNQEKQTTEHYLYEYMAKNLYYVYVTANQEYGIEDPGVDNKATFVALTPHGFTPDHFDGLTVSDDQWFWQAPK